MEIFAMVIEIITVILGVFVAYKAIYTIIGLFGKKKKYPDTEILNKYTFVIPARNEEAVIPKLIESINLLDYPKELYNIIVIADNCTDNTAKIAKNLGVTVFERFDDSKRRKGYALESLFDSLITENKLDESDAYIIVDADNLLKKDFLIEMNKGFVENGNVLCGYRSTKNFDTNIISASYGIHFFRSTVSLHRPRAILNVGTHLAGTGICIGTHLLKNGWHHTCLTEDTELTADLVSKGIKIGFVEDAVLYDEQPTNIFVACRQRLRWTKGRLTVFFKTFPKIIKSIFTKKSFTSYDFFWYYFPYGLATFILSLVGTIVPIIYTLAGGKEFDAINYLKYFGISLLGTYLSSYFLGIIYVIREFKNIKCRKRYIILYLFFWPWFDMIDIFITIVALFKRNVTWKTIKHTDTRNIDSLNNYRG